MTEETKQEPGGNDSSQAEHGEDSAFARCPRCGMRVRRLELDVHLAHAHDATRSSGGKAGRKRKGGGRARREN